MLEKHKQQWKKNQWNNYLSSSYHSRKEALGQSETNNTDVYI